MAEYEVAALPSYNRSSEHLREKFGQTEPTFVGGCDAIPVSVVARTVLPAVLFECWSRSTGIPTCFTQMPLPAWQAVSYTKTSALTSLVSRLTAGIVLWHFAAGRWNDSRAGADASHASSLHEQTASFRTRQPGRFVSHGGADDARSSSFEAP